ncbi:hypothetical protein ACMFMF_004608 [Clarireedia jacksonii]
MLRSLEQKKQYGASSRKLHLVEERYMPAVLLELQVGNRNSGPKLQVDSEAIGDETAKFYYVFFNLEPSIQAQVLPLIDQSPLGYKNKSLAPARLASLHFKGLDTIYSSNTPETLSGPYFRLPWDCQLKNGYSFVLGTLDPSLSDKSQCSCDFQLADSNASGISRRHMSVDIYEQHNADQRVSVRLNCLSQELIVQTLWPRVHNGTTISARDILKKGEHVPVNRITYDNIAYWVNEITQILPIIEG